MSGFISFSITNCPQRVFVVAQPLSHVQLLATPWIAACQTSMSFTITQSLLKLMSIESVMPYNHLFLCHPLLLLPSIFPNIRVFSNELSLSIRWPNNWSFNFSIIPPNEYSGLISLQSKGLSKVQHHSLKASVLQRSAFFIIQLSHPYMTAGKTIALTRWTFFSKVLFTMLSRFVIVFLPRSKCLLISWLQSP